ncbi:uncharacterized protein BO95DRAFT_285104 [Aspergillus brunneoviolaceus CBS 621.78]|uniref:Uncharacterized protein n=1 Tax=Aspergillus brunneoviolaceus CBS 621.78 TaxID=1450534 RepID=A0ACD1GJW0_9EURO|nr:hypothetical protein BO95DRAFT_285104 [Aspergillus brunneoviolaceus CBS 621.78]RAH49447.1 hypothetical protein BO95DRAFT_285104 [Aspergillus brunneoviolaceus CBS 621.78]
MCYKLVERFAACRCLYFQHAVDPCEAYGQRGHSVQEKVVLVGYACAQHSIKFNSGIASNLRTPQDSGYSSSKS